MSESLEDHAEKYWDWDVNKAVPLALLLAWMSRNHQPDPRGDDVYIYDRRPVVDYMALEKWAKSVAVTRVVDHGPHRDEKDVWSFFEDGWHKTGCETRLAQQRARIVRVDKDVAQKIQDGMVGGYSINGE